MNIKKKVPEEPSICLCGKSFTEFEDCPICGEKLCIDCEDWEKHHADEKDVDDI